MAPAAAAARSRPQAVAAVTAQPRTKLHITGLPRKLLDHELRARFEPFGAVFTVEVLREKTNSPFYNDIDADADAAGGGGASGGAGAKGGGGRGGANAKANKKSRAPQPPPPCRGFAYVEFTPTDDKSLSRCLTLYNGCKWKGGVMHVQPAKPRFDLRFRMEREGLDASGGAGGATESMPTTKADKTKPNTKTTVKEKVSQEHWVDDRSRARAHAGAPDWDGASGEAQEDMWRALREGDELEIDGRERNSKVRMCDHRW